MKAIKMLTLKEIANLTETFLKGNPDHLIKGVDDLESASSKEASFFSNVRYLRSFQKTSAGVVFIDPLTLQMPDKNYLISENPSESFQKLVDFFYPKRKAPSSFMGIHPTAIIHPTACLGENISIGPHAVIDENVIIGSNTFIGSGCYIGPEATIGKDCLIYSNVTIREACEIGDRVIIQPGAVIGSCGFGYITTVQGVHQKLNQVGNVKIEEDVEIGANTTIDRSRFKSTVICKGSKIDNLVQIGHGVEIGPHNMIIAQTGIAGSTKLGSHVVLAGQVAVAGHLKLGDGVIVAGKSGITKSLEKAGKYGGIPALPIDEYNRNQVLIRKILKKNQQ